MGMKPRKKPVKRNESSGNSNFLDQVNEERFDYNLPPISKEDWYRRQAKYMYEKHDYDIGS